MATMQNAIENPEDFINQDQSETDCDKQFSDDVIKYQNQVENIIAWLFSKEEELQQRPKESTLLDAPFNQVLDEYSRHEKFISEFCEYCHTIMKCKEDGQELKESDVICTQEDRDEIDIQMDAMMVCHQKLKILSTDRLHSLQRILEERQQTKIERFEEWLSAIEMKISSTNNIGPDYVAIQRQMKDMEELRGELEQKQDFLNFMSSVIVFDEVDPESLQIRSRSCESLDGRLERMNHRWIEICRLVDDRDSRLKKAESIWKLLNLEGPQLAAWLKKIERSLQELSEAARSISDVQADKLFVDKLFARSEKIDLEIKSKQLFYTSLENRVRLEIEKFDDPCSMLVIELEKKLEDMQDNWNTIMNRKRMLDFTLQDITSPIHVEPVRCNMIPLPDPITSASNSNLRFSSPLEANDFLSQDLHQNEENLNEHLSNSSSSCNDDKASSLQLNGSSSEPRAFDNSLSSNTRSLLYCNNHEQGQPMFNPDNNSEDELSSTSLTASYPINVISNEGNDTGTVYPGPGPSVILNHENKREPVGHHPDSQNYLLNDHHKDGAHSCRVEEWKHSLESFSTWLKQVETSLGIDTTLQDLVEHEDDHQDRQSWSRLDIYRQLILLNEIENQIILTCQDEFDCLILQGQQIIEDLIPEIGENEYEANLKDILTDIEIRYAAVKRCLNERKHELADKERWFRLLKSLDDLCDLLIRQMGQIIPETNIGVDMIILAQQLDELTRARKELEENSMIQSSMEEARLFLKLCEALQQQRRDQTHDLREDIESQLDRLTLHYSEVSQLINDRLARHDEVHKEMHGLQHKMQELATGLQVAEILRSSWVPLENLTIEKLSEQLEDLKLFRERLSETESIHNMMNSIFEWMTKAAVPLGQQNLNRISELNTIWSLIQVAVDERQKLIELAFDNQGASEQRFLTQTVEDLPRWERRVATSRVPYFVDHETGTTKWDHPKFNHLLNKMSDVKEYVFSAYRTAIKLRIIQKEFGIDLLMLEQLKEILDLPNYGLSQQGQATDTPNHTARPIVSNEAKIDVEQIIFFLQAIYERVQSEEKPSLDVPLSIDLTLNWLLNLYDSTRTGYISMLSLKVGLALLCCATREEKYIYMYELVANKSTGCVDARKLGTLFETCMRIPTYLGEGDSFGGAEIIEISIRNCFAMSKLNPEQPNSIDLSDYLNWLKSEPQFIIWLPVLHRMLVSENTVHQVKCKLCKEKPITGLRYRCLKCFKFNVCQKCFLIGRHIYEHFDPARHPMQEYCSTISSGENVRDLTKIIRNKLKPKASLGEASLKKA